LVDCGATSLVALRQQGFELNEIETVFVTHLHGDHFGGLPFLILDGQFRRRTKDLTVVGPAGTEQRLAEAMETFFPNSSGVRRRFSVNVVEHEDRRPFKNERVTAVPYEVRHASGAPAFAIKVEDAETSTSVAYSGDTEWTDSLFDAAEGADVFLCEGYTPAPVRWHLDLGTLAEKRHRFTCERMVLTHMSPTVLESDLTGWETAFDGMVIAPHGQVGGRS
jgi:ribonuclease BN (tRNA processing enzyme)